jgi:hypothetical protein
MTDMTQEQIKALDGAQLRAIVRSTNPNGAYSQQVIWARNEIAQRNASRQRRSRTARPA